MPDVIRPDLRYTEAKAIKLTRLLRDRLDMSQRVISQAYKTWDRLEEEYRAYRPVDDEDRESLRKNDVQKIIVPIQFATAQTMLTFMMEVFTALKPVLRVRGTDPATKKKSRVMEVALDYDYRGNRGYFTLYQWFLNAFRYSYGIIENTWGTRTVLKNVVKPGAPSFLELDGQQILVPGTMELRKDYFTTFEGNRWRIADNRRWFPDPRVTLSNFHEGEFCGKRDLIHYHDLKKLELDGLFFNTSLVRAAPAGSMRDAEFASSDNQRSRIRPEFFTTDLRDARKAKMHVNEEIYIDIIPEEFGLGDEDRPEKWVFNLIDGQIIVRAEPSPFIRFPYEIVEVYPDVLGFMSQGIMEITSPLARHISFLFNSHMANVRKAVNDMMLVDPSRIDIRDLLDPRAGKVIRLLPLAYGTDPSLALKQLGVVDVTRGHVEDSKMILDLWMRITGASDAMFGNITASRRTAFELGGVFKMGASRMKTIADLFSSEGVAPLTEQMAVLRQENMSMEQFMEIGGQTAADLGVAPEEIVEGFLKVRRDHISGVFSYPAEEGVLPQDRVKAAELLQKAFDTVSRSPILPMFFDPVGIFREMMRQSGYHNIDEFMNQAVRADASLVTSDQLQNMLARGSVQPMGRPNRGVREDREGLTPAGAFNGSGRTRTQE